MIILFSNIIPILNGRDSNNEIIYLGPQGTKIHRYLLLAYLAKSAATFQMLGKEVDNSLYFTLYSLGNVANYFKKVKPFLTAIAYDRRKVGSRIYNMLTLRGYIDIRKINGDTYVTTTEKGDEICNRLLIELITFAKLSDIAPKLLEPNLSIERYKVIKGVRSTFLRENANLNMVAERLTDNILEINSHFKDEIKAIDDEP